MFPAIVSIYFLVCILVYNSVVRRFLQKFVDFLLVPIQLSQFVLFYFAAAAFGALGY